MSDGIKILLIKKFSITGKGILIINTTQEESSKMEL
jgi:hypothetical protein